MADKEIYALFEYYGDGIMVPKNYLCIRYGTPEHILNWLLNDGYLMEILYWGSQMGKPSDRKYLNKIMTLSSLTKVTVGTIRGIDLRMPSCCTCRAVSKSVKDMHGFGEKLKSMLAADNIGTVKNGEDLKAFLLALDNACESQENTKPLLMPCRTDIYK